MSEVSLGRFGDRRLEKGGSFCTLAWLRPEGAGFEFDGWEPAGPERFA